jgi:hypothetical protein
VSETTPAEVDASSSAAEMAAAMNLGMCFVSCVVCVSHKQQQLITTTTNKTGGDDARELRVFVSSPFRDMVAERDFFAKHVVPALRKVCSQRDVLLSFVDLRWGVTDSAAEQAATLLVCLREIEACNVFVGMYGARYGFSQSADALKGLPNKVLSSYVSFSLCCVNNTVCLQM